MNNFKKLSLTLALLITAVGGAWAQDPDYDIDVHFDDHYNPNQTPFDCRIMNLMDPEAEIKGTLDLSVDDLKGSFNVDGELFFGTIDALDAGDHTWSAEFKPVGGGSFKRNGNFKIKKAYTSIYYNGSTSINLGVGESTELDVYMNPSEAGELNYSSSDASVASITKESSFKYIIQANAAGTATITFSFAGSTNYNAADNKTITVTVLTPPIEVTTNAASAQDLFTEASFKMPASDVTVDYTLVRDLDDQTNKVTFTGLPTTITDPIIVKKGDNGTYQPIKTLTIQLIDPQAAEGAQNIIAADGITVKVLLGAVNGQGAIDYDQENPITLKAFLADMTPGQYWIWAVASGDDSPYDGTAFSSQFMVIEQYDLTVKPANDFSKGKIESVTVGTEEITPDANTGEAAKTGIAPGTEVKLKAKKGYIIEEVEAKKPQPLI